MTAALSPPPRDGQVCCLDEGAPSSCTPARCPAFRPAAPSEPPAADSPTPGTERRAPVQSDREHPNGSVAWWEHEQAWQDYHRRYPSQDAETIAKRAGFSYAELVDHLGHAPTTWQVGATRYVPPAAPSPVGTTEPPAETPTCACGGPCEHDGSLAREMAYQEGRWCGECRYGVVEDPLCCTMPPAETQQDDEPYSLAPPLEGLSGDSVLADLHAKWHDEPGNLMGPDDCGWKGCEVYAILQAVVPALAARPSADTETLRLVRELHRPWYEVNGVRHDNTVTVPCSEFAGCTGDERVDCPESDGDGHEALACYECRCVVDYDLDGYLLWPCPTIRLLDGGSR